MAVQVDGGVQASLATTLALPLLTTLLATSEAKAAAPSAKMLAEVERWLAEHSADG